MKQKPINKGYVMNINALEMLLAKLEGKTTAIGNKGNGRPKTSKGLIVGSDADALYEWAREQAETEGFFTERQAILDLWKYADSEDGHAMGHKRFRSALTGIRSAWTKNGEEDNTIRVCTSIARIDNRVLFTFADVKDNMPEKIQALFACDMTKAEREAEKTAKALADARARQSA